MKKGKIGSNKIYLVLKEETNKKAKGAVEIFKCPDKYVFCIKYEPDLKSMLLTEIQRLKCEVLKHSDEKSSITIRASIEQLAAIKNLYSINKVKMKNRSITDTSRVSIKNFNDNKVAETTLEEIIPSKATDNVIISGSSSGACYGNNYNDFNEKLTGYFLPLST